ncbi:MAG: hypothetical protein WDM90_02970 [Ferruginibacter sp.]
MKKVLLSILLLTVLLVAYAQDAKPTKEQTVEYLINVLNNYSIEGERESGPSTRKIKIEKIQFNDCELNFTIYSKSTFGPGYDEKVTFYTLNIKDIEAMESSSGKYGNSTFYYLTFNCYNNKELISSSIASQKTSGNTYKPNELKQTKQSSLSIIVPVNSEEKIYKAFNYLRKLCGAPEPIQF